LWRSVRLTLRGALTGGAGAIHPRNRLGDFGLSDDQRRYEARNIVAGADRQEFLGADSVDQLAVWNLALEPDQKPFAAYLGDHCWVPIPDLGQTLLEQQRDVTDVFEETRLGDHVEHRVANGA